MAGYLGSTPVPQATQHRESFTCTEGQTSFATAGYTPQFLDVFLNGSHLSPADFVATNSSDVVLVVAASADDVCDIVSYTPFEVADQTFTGTTTMDVAAITGILTTTAKAVSNGGIGMPDDAKLTFGGTGTGDLQIYHDGSHSLIEEVGTGALKLKGEDIRFEDSDGNNIIKATSTAAELYFSGSKKIETTNTGVAIAGGLTATSTVQIQVGESLSLQNAAGSAVATIQCAGAGGNSDLGFSTAAAERMRIHSTGQIAIGTTAAPTTQSMLLIQGDGGTDNMPFIEFQNTATSNDENLGGFIAMIGTDSVGQVSFKRESSTSSGYFQIFTQATGGSIVEHFRINGAGAITATDTSIGSNSDERLKETVADYTYDIAKFKQYAPKTFEWKNKSVHGNKINNRGFLAQAVKAIDDRWIGEINVSVDSLDYDIISDNVSLTSKLGEKDAMYISVIQQLIERVEALEG